MRVLTILGTRPEIIRLSLIIKILDEQCEHRIVHTGQNFQDNLSRVFFDELDVRAPDVNLEIRGPNFGMQVGHLFERIEEEFDSFRPQKILILGDTNSALSAVVAARRQIPVYHMEAGNRCYDDRVPEEVNRRIIDHSSSVLLPYTERSKENLVREGIERERIFVTGNPIFEVLDHFETQIDQSLIHDSLNIAKNGYFLATVHRAENVDNDGRLRSIFEAFEAISREYQKPVLVSVHPRTAERLDSFRVKPDAEKVRLFDALGFFDFINLEKKAFAILTDSGTVQEECAIMRIPNVTIRDVTERPETVECGSNIIGGTEVETIMRAVAIAVSRPSNWNPPDEYLSKNVSQTVCKIVLGHTSLRMHR